MQNILSSDGNRVNQIYKSHEVEAVQAAQNSDEKATTQRNLTIDTISKNRIKNNSLLGDTDVANSLGKSVPVAQNVNSVAGIVGHMHQSHNFSPLPKGSYSKPSTSNKQGIAVDIATSNSFTRGFEQSEQIMIQKNHKTLSGACAEGVRIGIEKSFHTRIGPQGHANQVIGNMVNNGTAKKLGYTEISYDPKTYVPREGDIMSMSKTSTKLGTKFGHIGAYTKNGWYADGKQNKAFGNTIAFKQGDWEKIQRGEIKVRVLRLGEGIGNSVLNVTGLKGATRKKG